MLTLYTKEITNYYKYKDFEFGKEKTYFIKSLK